MGFDKPFVKRALAKPGHVTNLLRIKGDCYTKIGDLKAEAIKSDEPIAFADLDKSAFKPIRKWEKWAEEQKLERITTKNMIGAIGLYFNTDKKRAEHRSAPPAGCHVGRKVTFRPWPSSPCP